MISHSSLLFLLLPSCMVASIGNIANKFIFPSTLSTISTSRNSQTLLPTVNESSNTGMDKFTRIIPVNNFKSRGRSSSIEKNPSRDTSMFSTCSSVAYHERVTLNNDMDVDLPIDFPTLSYEEEQEKNICLRKVAETTINMRPQGGTNKASSSQVNHGDHIPNERSRG